MELNTMYLWDQILGFKTRLIQLTNSPICIKIVPGKVNLIGDTQRGIV